MSLSLFFSSLCKFTLPTGTGAETTFTRRSGGTPTSLTGPSGDSSASGDGYYMYSEASGMTATEVQLELRVNHTFCSQGVSFWCNLEPLNRYLHQSHSLPFLN